MSSPKLRPTAVAATLSVAAFALVLSACTAAQPSGSQKSTPTQSSGTPAKHHAGSTSPSGTSSSPSPAKTHTGPPPTKVHIVGFPDNQTVGVGMPIIVQFNKKITSAKTFVKDTTVTVNGKNVDGGWYFEDSDPKSGHVMEAHYRTQNFWPADAHIHVAFDLKGAYAGKHNGRDMVYDGKLTSLDFQTGARTIAVVDDSSHTMKVTSNGKSIGTYPVSLGAADTPTRSGIKVIMDQQPTVCMTDTASTYYECGIKWDQRLTYDGEYLHSAPWNIANLGHNDTSNGCTNLSPVAAEKLYHFMRIGDVVEYPNADGPKMQLGEGYGDWNVEWGQWQTGGALNTQV